jgi:cellulose synthase/poly-beta-1,6-N-acetylglucosamine synthase-like glycosyltransferase
MGSMILTISFIALGIALGEYVFYNLLMLVAGVKRSPRRADVDFTPPVTVIIPAYNEEKHIRQKLENVLESDYPRDLLEVIVVDDGSTDATAQIVREFEGVILLETGERRGKIAAQKLAFEHASAPIVAITDATVLAPAYAVRTLAEHFEDPNVGAVSAAITVRNRATNYLTRMAQFLFDVQNAQKLAESLLDSAGGLFGQFSLVRREALGDFQTDVIYEDREFGITLRKRGYRALLEPSVKVEYYAAESLDDFSRQKQRNIGAMTQSIFRHRGLLFNPRFGWYGMAIFPEYSLFRVLRAYLLAIAFAGAIFASPGAGWAFTAVLVIWMLAVTIGCYLFGTMLLAPLVDESDRFILDAIVSIPAMALMAFHFVTASLRYFRGDFSSLWQRVKRDRAA